MKYLAEYRDPEAAQEYCRAIHAAVTRDWAIMEICGGQTHALLRYGITEMLPPGITLIHGPGCPVCVTPLEALDTAVELAARPEVIFCSFGDMLRVPGSAKDLLTVKSEGGDVRVVYAPLDAVRLARENPHRQVVFFAVGFETTAPPNALAVAQAKREELTNFSMLVSHVLVPPAMEAILAQPGCCVQGFLAAGHVCTVMGFREYEPLVARYKTPIVVTGFEPLDLLQGLLMVVRQLEAGRYEVENQYARAVQADGNAAAQALLREVFVVADRKWRGIGEIPVSGLALAPAYADFDATRRFALDVGEVAEPPECRSGEVLQGRLKPPECEAFGTTCTPEHPLGATMVSSEGACAAYYRYRREAV